MAQPACTNVTTLKARLLQHFTAVQARADDVFTICLRYPLLQRQLGHEDAERLMPALQPMFFKALEQDKTREPWVIDIGSSE
jgi:hypothetical protein